MTGHSLQVTVSERFFGILPVPREGVVLVNESSVNGTESILAGFEEVYLACFIGDMVDGPHLLHQ